MVAGCYRPELRDCVVECNTVGDCAPGLVCDDGFCAAARGTCVDGPNGRPNLIVVVVRLGRVNIQGQTSCENTDNGEMHQCEYVLPPGDMIKLMAMKVDGDFSQWDGCPQEVQKICHVTTTNEPITVTAQFDD